MNTVRRRAIIVGGSVAGLFAAHFLRRSGWDIALYERSRVHLEGRGAGIMTHPEIDAALRMCGCATTTDFGVPITWREAYAVTGELAARLHCPQIATTWNRIYALLASGLDPGDYHLDKTMVAIDQDAAGASAIFADGTRVDGDVIIGADGVRSRTRAFVAPGADLEYAGYVAWRALAEEAHFTPELHAAVFEKFVFALPPGEQFLGYPVAGPNDDIRPGHRWWNIVWYRPADAHTELPGLLTDETGKQHDGAIPPPLIAAATIAALHQATARLLPSHLQAVMAIAGQPFLQPIYDLRSQTLASGRVALIGDAAFVVRPHVGAGVVKAAEDAEALSRHLAAYPEIPSALLAYDQERRPIGMRFVAHARKLGSYLKTRFASEAERAEAARFAAPQTVLEQTARLDFIRR